VTVALTVDKAHGHAAKHHLRPYRAVEDDDICYPSGCYTDPISDIAEVYMASPIEELSNVSITTYQGLLEGLRASV